ncbi:MAG: hypothetical protein NTX45_02355 [Proteobacteria bacterium]|nr:hypothetical protein [Pseudomonadota bacterium]
MGSLRAAIERLNPGLPAEQVGIAARRLGNPNNNDWVVVNLEPLPVWKPSFGDCFIADHQI